jgi:hypothetical protein
VRRALALTLVAVLAAAAIAVAGSTPKITKYGVDGVKVGATYQQLREKGLVGKIRHGCELGGPNTRSATLKAPLKGQVNFTLKTPRKVTDITVRGGATARGVGIGDRTRDIKAAYPKAKVDHGTDETFGVTVVRVPKSGGGRIMFAVDTDTKRITLIGVPFIGFCE